MLKDLADNLISKGEQLNNAIEPKMSVLFKALEPVNPGDVRVVILGQDPTPQKDKATGVAFHVEKPRFVPAVLHMFLEVAFEGFPVDLDKGDVTNWAKQGVLLLNTALTCPHNPPKGVKDKTKYKSHFDIWKYFTISLIRYIGGEAAEPSVWLLWGRKAKDFSKHIDEKHLIIEGGHPSPTGTAKHGDSFFGVNYFNRANQFLSRNGRGFVDWSLSVRGLNSLTLTSGPDERKKLLKEKDKIRLRLGKIHQKKKKKKIQKKRKHEAELKKFQKEEESLMESLVKINKQLNQLPLEQLKDHYNKMVRKIEDIQRKGVFADRGFDDK